MRVTNERLRHLAENMTTLDPEFQSMAHELKIMRKELEKAVRESINYLCSGCAAGWPIEKYDIHEDPNSNMTVGCNEPAIRKALQSLDTLEES